MPRSSKNKQGKIKVPIFVLISSGLPKQMKKTENRNLLKIYNLKDSTRYYWQIEVWNSGKVPSGLNDDSFDFEWTYQIFRQSGSKKNLVYSGSIVGQYDLRPKIRDIMQEYANYVISVVVDFSVDNNEN